MVVSDVATFTLTIELGNDAMQTGTDVGAALRALAWRMDSVGDTSPEGRSGLVRDDNGNKVGAWAVSES